MDPAISPTIRRLVPIVCWLGLLADGYDMAAYGVALPGLIGPHPWGITSTEAGVVGSVALVGAVIGAVVAGTLTDVFGRRRLFIGGLVLFSLAMILSGIAPNFAVFTVGRFCCGIGFGGLIPASVALTAEFAPPRYRSRILGLVLTGLGLGAALAGVVGLLSLSDHGFRPVFLVGGFPLVTAVPLAIALVPESTAFRARDSAVRASRAATGAVRGLFTAGMRWSTVGLWVVAPLLLINLWGVTTWLPKLMIQAGFALSASLIFLLAYTGSSIAGTLVGAVIADRLGAKLLVILGALLNAIGLASLAATHTGGVLLAAVAIAGLGAGAAQNLLHVHIAGFYPPETRATGLGWAAGFGRAGSVVGPVYGAVMVSAAGGVSTAALAFAAPALLAGLVMIAVKSRPLLQNNFELARVAHAQRSVEQTAEEGAA